MAEDLSDFFEAQRLEEMQAKAAGTEPEPVENRASLSLTDLEPLTGISYVTLQRYAQAHGDRLPHEGDGRARRYYPEAVEVFKRIKEENQTRRRGAVRQDTPARPKKKPKAKWTGKRRPSKPITSKPAKSATAAPSVVPAADQMTAAFEQAFAIMRINVIDELIGMLNEAKTAPRK